MAEILSDRAEIARRYSRAVWLRRLAAALVGFTFAATFLMAWPKAREAVFWAGEHTPEEIVKFILETEHIPGAALAFGFAGEQPRLIGYGHNRDGTSVAPDQVFPIASLSKPITAAAILKLVEEGRISLDGHLTDLVPASANAPDPRYRDITVRHLLQHSSGWVAPPRYNVAGDDCTPIALDAMQRPLEFNPGERHVYSNIGYCWLEMIIAARSGPSYEAFVRDHILEPAGASRLTLTNRLYGGFGGWSGTVLDFFRFASQPPSPLQTSEKPIRLEEPPVDYSLGVVAMDGATGHWGWLTGATRVFTLVLRASNGATAVAFFNDHPTDARATAAKALAAFRKALDALPRPSAPRKGRYGIS